MLGSPTPALLCFPIPQLYMASIIGPNQYVALRLPSDQVKVEQVVPNTILSLGKYGSFQANQILGRPFHITFEILDRAEASDGEFLRMVPAAELHADALIQQVETSGGSPCDPSELNHGNELEMESRTNKSIFDDPTNQKLTMAEIEFLKSDGNGSNKALVAKILDSHATIDEKSAFSLAKYTVRKNKKYLRRFCVLPLDVFVLTNWLHAERDFGKVMELRNEALGLIGCWANIHKADSPGLETGPSGNYLMVDDTGGLLVAAMAERMGILHPEQHSANTSEDQCLLHEQDDLVVPANSHKTNSHDPAMSARQNTITLLHTNSQPNLALLRYFSFDVSVPARDHPLYTHLKTLSWLQLLLPSYDSAYAEPVVVPPEALALCKSSKRSAYHRKRRRWTRVRSVIDSTRQGGFHGLVLATATSAVSTLRHAVPLLAGGAQVVIYSPYMEPLAELADLYSTVRRTAFISAPEEQRISPSDDFPLDPTLLLVLSIQTVRVKSWQTLPGRTHPLMMGKGGAEGYIFVATRVSPAPGRVEARGRIGGKRRRLKSPSATLRADHAREICTPDQVEMRF